MRSRTGGDRGQSEGEYDGNGRHGPGDSKVLLAGVSGCAYVEIRMDASFWTVLVWIGFAAPTPARRRESRAVRTAVDNLPSFQLRGECGKELSDDRRIGLVTLGIHGYGYTTSNRGSPECPSLTAGTDTGFAPADDCCPAALPDPPAGSCVLRQGYSKNAATSTIRNYSHKNVYCMAAGSLGWKR